MDVSEKIFEWLHAGDRARRSRIYAGRSVLKLAEGEFAERLELLACALNERELRIVLSDALDPPDEHALFLPRQLGLGVTGEDGFSVCLYRVMLLHGALQTGQRLPPELEGVPELLVFSALKAPALNRVLLEKYSGFAALLASVRRIASEATEIFLRDDPGFAAWGAVVLKSVSVEDFALSVAEKSALLTTWKSDWVGSPYCPAHVVALLPVPETRRSSAGNSGEAPGDQSGSHQALPKGSQESEQEIRIKTVARPKIKTLDERAENPLSHVFEKLLTADQHQGGSKTQDGSDETKAHADALSELTLESVVRTQTGADSVLRANAQLDCLMPDLGAGEASPMHRIYSYPEWFHEARRYRQDYCKVFESVLPPGDGVGVGLTPEHSGLSEKLSAFLNESRWKPRQKDGPEFDLDAVVRWRSQLHGSGPVDQRVYMGRRRLERNIAVLVLLDSSLSTDAWVGNRRVLDVMKSSIMILGQAFAGLDDRFAIATFNSYSRQRCDFKWVKGFEEDWRCGRQRLASVKPDGFTRIGPALRHSFRVLDETRARRKLLLIFSDAKPTDYDRYEGEHGLADVGKAVAEIKAQGIFVRGIAVAQENRANLARMFGSGQYEVISEPLQIAGKVVQIFTQIMA